MSAPRIVAAVLAIAAAGCASSQHRTAATAPTPQAPAPDTTPATPTRPAPPPLSEVARLHLAIDSMVADTEFRNANWGILIVDPDKGDTLYSHNAGKLFMPASNMKIETGSVALALLGPDFRFRTTFVAGGPVCDGTVHGDLVVDGRGDPSVSDDMAGDAMLPLDAIADSLAARGIHRVTGDVVNGTDAFPGPTIGYGWSWDDLSYPYGAGVDELYFNEGFAQVVVRAGRRPGARVHAELLPATGYPRLRITATTAFAPESLSLGSGGRAVPSSGLEAAQDTTSGVVVVSGWIPPGTVDTVDVVYPRQVDAYLAALRTALQSRGIRVHARVARTRCARAHGGGNATAFATGDTLYVAQSPPLRDVLHAMLKPSQNQIAEVLIHTIGLEETGVGAADSGIVVVRRQLLAWGAQPDGFVQHDGSGLSRYDYLSPETIVHTLAAIRKDTAFAAFYDGLPIAGVDGTLEYRMRGTPAQGNVHAKTGYVANARSLSGYVTTADGHMLIFSALCNNWTVSVHDVERVQDAIAARLASLTLGPGS